MALTPLHKGYKNTHIKPTGPHEINPDHPLASSINEVFCKGLVRDGMYPSNVNNQIGTAGGIGYTNSVGSNVAVWKSSTANPISPRVTDYAVFVHWHEPAGGTGNFEKALYCERPNNNQIMKVIVKELSGGAVAPFASFVCRNSAGSGLINGDAQAYLDTSKVTHSCAYSVISATNRVMYADSTGEDVVTISSSGTYNDVDPALCGDPLDAGAAALCARRTLSCPRWRAPPLSADTTQS